MTPIKKMRPLFFNQQPSSITWDVIALFVIVVLALAASWYYRSDWHITGISFAPETVREYKTPDGKAVCYKIAIGVSCLPVWLLDRPQNWIVAYPTPKKERGK